MFQITTVEQLIYKAGVKCMVYGASGVGKTRLALSCPRPLVFSAERGVLSLKGSGIHAAEISNMNDLRQAHDWALRQGSGSENYMTFIFDSITEIAEVVLANEMVSNKDPRKSYGNMATEVMAIFRNFRDYSYKHVIFIAQEEKDKDENGIMMYQPSLPGQQVARKSPYIVDECFRMFTYTDQQSKQSWPLLRCRKSMAEVAKDRSGTLNEFEAPDMNAIFNKILA